MSNTLGPWPVVQNGSQGHPIRTLKFLLRARGHNLAVDGIPAFLKDCKLDGSKNLVDRLHF